jgi:hypothetical protein
MGDEDLLKTDKSYPINQVAFTGAQLMSRLAKVITIVVLLAVIAGCCVLPDVPGPIGIPGC